MNIFFLDSDPSKASQYHVDKHVVKMPLETAQMLCTVHWKNNSQAPYKPTHLKHPSTLWAGQSLENYLWLCNLGKELCKEYTFRYAKRHKCEDIIDWAIKNLPTFEHKEESNLPLAMPDDFKVENNLIESYRNYYRDGKKHLHKWTNRNQPNWI
jgi:hypothetical protein